MEREIKQQQTCQHFDQTDDLHLSKDNSCKSAASSESRISSLTEALLMKQALLEVVVSDKTALALKVEKLEVYLYFYRLSIKNFIRFKLDFCHLKTKNIGGY